MLMFNFNYTLNLIKVLLMAGAFIYQRNSKIDPILIIFYFWPSLSSSLSVQIQHSGDESDFWIGLERTSYAKYDDAAR
jgi:hypothetical protein